jgi:mannose-binding lectin 2
MFRIIGIFLITATLSTCAKINDLSFEPPFNDVDHAGERVVSKQWRSYGATSVSTNFARLTPDRQSKKGALWSRRAIGTESVSAVLKFRISGQGKQFFGDGLALWIVTQGYYMEGELHGYQEEFTGVGIIFDTYKNTENIQSHRDVTVLVNNGNKNYQMMTETIEGCNINVRYHAERADFNVKDSVSRVKFLLTDNGLMNIKYILCFIL